MKISYSAPAKVILSGEHAVVYGKPALVSAINLRLKFSLTILERSRLRQGFGGQACQDGKTDKEICFINQNVKDYLKIQKINFVDKPFSFEIDSEIPVGRGLGSSAALSVASVAAFLEFYTGLQFKKEIVNNLAFQIEKHFHKNPSGVDNSASCFGGLILYKKLTYLKKLDYKISKKINDSLLLIDTGKPVETTGEMVEYVSTKKVENILDKIEKQTNKILEAIKKENINLFKEGLVHNEKLLEELGVVSEKTKKLLKDLSKFGVGKITGAGGRKKGSGFILFCSIDIDNEELIEYLDKRKINFYKFIPDSQGLTRL